MLTGHVHDAQLRLTSPATFIVQCVVAFSPLRSAAREHAGRGNRHGSRQLLRQAPVALQPPRRQSDVRAGTGCTQL